MKYIFILGRNKKLSKVEISEFLKSINIEFSIPDEGRNFLIIEAEKIDDIANKLGGTIKIGRILDESDKLSSLNFDIDVDGLFAVSVCNIKSRIKIANRIKKYNREKGRKVNFFQTRKNETTAVEIIKRNLIGNEIIVVKAGKFYVFRTFSVYNPFEFKKLDIGRPEQRGMLSISIRLARIMFNMANLKKGKSMIDPFCGYGTILQEGVLNGTEVFGSDSDKECCMASKINLKWLCNEYEIDEKFKIKNIDVFKIAEFSRKFDAIITEPYLGPPLRKSVSETEAEKIADGLEGFYKKVVDIFSKNLQDGGRIVMTLPIIRTRKKEFRIKKENILPDGFAVRSFDDILKKHIVAREICVFEKV